MTNNTPATVRAPLPAAPIAHPLDSPQTYRMHLALYCLQHIPEHGAICTAGLTDEQLESAALGLNHALTQRAIIGTGDQAQSTPETVYNALAATLVFVRSMQAGREKYRQEQAAATVEAASKLIEDTHPNGGKTVPVPPPPPKPLSPQHQPVPARPMYQKIADVGF